MSDTPFLQGLPDINLITILDIVLVALLLYQFFLIIRGRRAVAIITGVLILIAVYAVAVQMGMALLRSILETVVPYSAFALIVMFQSDIRRLLARLGRRRALGGQSFDRHAVIQELVFTLEALSASRTGALIVLERDIGLRTFVESGLRIDGLLSRDLLLAIFHPKAAMHDGAVIVHNDRVAAAACFLPLSTNPRLPSFLGTRHRAAIGVTEEADCLSLVVSEETGGLSVAVGGHIHRNLKLPEVQRRIAEHFGLGKKRATSGSADAEAAEAASGSPDFTEEAPS